MSSAPTSSTDADAEEASARTIRRTSRLAAGLAVVLSPVPFADEVALVPLYARMIARIARAHGRAARRLPWRSLATIGGFGLLVRAGVNAPFCALPGVAAAVNAATAFGLTTAYGACAERLCADPTLSADVDLRTVFATLRAGDADSG